MGNLKFTFKAWPVVTAVTIGLSFATQGVAALFGIDLPEQSNVELVRQWGLNCLRSWRNFGVFAGLVGQVVVLLPVVEELLFRGLLFSLPVRLIFKGRGDAPSLRRLGPFSGRDLPFLALSSVLFSAAHYLQQPFPDNAFVALFFFGLAQCWLYRKTGALWCAMLNHALFNLTNLVLLFVLPAP